VIRERLATRYKVAVHLVWFSLLCPFLAIAVFLFARVRSDTDHSLPLAIATALSGSAIGVALVLPNLLVAALVGLVVVGFLRRRASQVAIAVIVLSTPWVLLRKGEGATFFTDHPVVLLTEAVVFAAVTALLCDYLGVHSLFLRYLKKMPEEDRPYGW
jgi:hypothetical protein